MSISFGLAMYFILWWLVFYAMLPIGVRSQAESEDIVPGSEAGAPVAPRIGLKVLWTTLVSAALFAAGYALVAYEVVDLNKMLFDRP